MADTAAGGRSLFEAWERRDFDAMEDALADGVSFDDVPRAEAVKGKAAVRDWYAAWAVACPDSVAGATLVAASDDTAVFQGVYTGTNAGPFGPLAATGRTVSLPWVNVLRFDGAGRIIGGGAYYDQMTILTQLGHLAPPAGP